MGHAIYSSYSMDHQESIYAEPIIFTQEVASTTNELLYYSYMMEHAATEEERIFHLENMLSTFAGTFFKQALYAELNNEYPVDPNVPVSALVASWPKLTPDQVSLTELAKLRPDALRLVEEVNFDG